MDAFLKNEHRELQRKLDGFVSKVELADSICEDANLADAYIKTWAKTQHELIAKRKPPRALVQYLDKIEKRGFTTDGILGTVAKEIVRLLGQAGFLKYVVPKKHGGETKEVEATSLCLIRRNLAERSSLADSMFIMQGLGSYPITYAGTEKLRSRYLKAVATGDKIAAFACTEPNAGSDIASMETTAVKKKNGYVLNGVKTLISNAGIADFYVVFAKTDPRAEKRGISAFVVDKEAEGLNLTRRLELMAPHPIGEIELKDAFVPADHRLGGEGDGFSIAVHTLDLFRATVGASALGMASRALKEALVYTTRRRQFGKLLSEFQGIKFAIAEMATELKAAELMVFNAAYQKDHGANTHESSMAKLFATEIAQQVIDRALQIHGGNGVIRGNVVERLYREVRALRIYEGTSEIQKLIIARSLLGH